MLDAYPNKIISETAKCNSKVAKSYSSIESKSEFWYWLGYWNGQDSITNPEQNAMTITQESKSDQQ